MSSSWEDFEEQSRVPKHKEIKNDSDKLIKNLDNGEEKSINNEAACDWGFSGQQHEDDYNNEINQNLGASSCSGSSKFIPIYEKYLENKETFSNSSNQTKNNSMFINNPQKTLREWFENEDNEFKIKTEQIEKDKFVCSIDIPLDEHDFTITTENHNKKHQAIDELCLIACKMLDECDLLYSSWNSGTNSNKDSAIDSFILASEKKRQFSEANKEDDIELDSTKNLDTKRHCDSSNYSKDKQISSNKINTYDSLMADWREINMSILMLKAKLVKLDLSITKDNKGKLSKGSQKTDDDEEEEIDPLDEFMSSLETKTQLTMDEKIEKTRIKSEIVTLESKQAELSRLIELAKPKFDFDKATKKVSNK